MQIGSKAIAEIQRIAASAKPAVEDIGEYFVGVIQRRLSSGQGSTLGWGGTASSYSQGYANRKKGGNTYPVTLIDTGQMVKSIQVLSGRGIRSTPAGKGSKLRGGPRTLFIRAEDASIEIGLPEGRSADLQEYTPPVYTARSHLLSQSRAPLWALPCKRQMRWAGWWQSGSTRLAAQKSRLP